MSAFESIIIVIPSLDPDEKLVSTVNGLIKAGFGRIIIVNDGSKAENLRWFSALSELPQCTVLAHDKNRGKGAALKTAFDHVLKNLPEYAGVITVDGDGQHHPDDVVALASALERDKNAVILGARDFSRPEVPFRSRFGNRLTSFLFGAVCRRHISDTQTGLRAIPMRYLGDIAALEGERFEFETNMLLALSPLKIPLREMKIRTIYLDENSASHFRALTDSWLIVRRLFKFGASSLFCSLLDVGSYWLVTLALRFLPLHQMVLAATVVSRVISSQANYFLNRGAVFAAKENGIGSMPRYYLLCACQLFCSWAGVWGLTALTQMNSVISKLIVDTLLFFISYRIQRDWVFSGSKKAG